MSRTLRQQILHEVADFFEQHPERWIEGYPALNRRRRKVPHYAPSAYYFCAMGRVQWQCKQYGIPNIKIGDAMAINDCYGRKAVIKYLRDLANGTWCSPKDLPTTYGMMSD